MPHFRIRSGQFFGLISMCWKTADVRERLGYLPQILGLPESIAECMLIISLRWKAFGSKSERKHVKTCFTKVIFTPIEKGLRNLLGGIASAIRDLHRLLIGSPSLLLSHKPDAGLDPLGAKQILHLLSEIGENTVVILSTPYRRKMRVWIRFAQYGRSSGQGEVLMQGKPCQEGIASYKEES